METKWTAIAVIGVAVSLVSPFIAWQYFESPTEKCADACGFDHSMKEYKADGTCICSEGK